MLTKLLNMNPQHLNRDILRWFLGVYIAYCVVCAGGIMLDSLALVVASYVFFIFTVIAISLKGLAMKGRSKRHMGWLLLPFGLVVILLLKDKSVGGVS